MKNPTLLLVDGHNLLWRAAFGFPARIHARDGRDVTAEFGFFALLRVGQRELESDGGAECVVVFDGQHGADDRRQLQESYKQNRIGIDMTPILALEGIKAALNRQDLKWYEDEYREADDVVASLAGAYRDRPVVLMSTDRDLYQLLDERVVILNTRRKAGKRIINAECVRRQFGVEPSQWCDYRALTGDPSDGIRGVRGIGAKTAARLLSNGKTLDDLKSGNVVAGRAGACLKAMWEEAYQSRELSRLRRDISVAGLVDGRISRQLPRAAEVMDAVGLWERAWKTLGPEAI